MNIQRGDVVLVAFPFSSGSSSKVRPAVVVQNDRGNRQLTNTILVAITRTTRRTHSPTQLFIEASGAEGQQMGLLFDSAVTCENIATVEQRLIQRKIGTLPSVLIAPLEERLKAALGLP